VTQSVDFDQLAVFWLRSGLKPARTSSDKSCGCSHAAKCPPLLCFFVVAGFGIRPFCPTPWGLIELIRKDVLRAPSMMMTGGKKTMLSRNVPISRRKVACSICGLEWLYCRFILIAALRGQNRARRPRFRFPPGDSWHGLPGL